MNQTKKRLSIINLAISITDIETIQLQVLKLGLLKTDEKIQEIIAALQDENYAQSQELIQDYIDTPNHEILQRTFQEVRENRALTNMEEEDDMLTLLDDVEGKEKETIPYEDPFDSLLHIQTEEDKAITKANEETKEEESQENEHRVKQSFWDEENTEEEETEKVDHFFEVDKDENIVEESIEDTEHNVTENEETGTTQEEESLPSDTIAQETSDAGLKEIIITNVQIPEDEIETLHYKAIPYIDQKFKNMQVQYPVKEVAEEHFDSVDNWLIQISKNGYSEQDIEQMIEKIHTLKKEEVSEAAQLLLISAATESKYAQFQLARELFRGDVLEKNLPEAFTLINRLAVNDDYPEAICDLAQLYEYGIGIGKDKKQALALYEEAMEQGIQRAAEHVERLTKENKGFFSFLKR